MQRRKFIQSAGTVTALGCFGTQAASAKQDSSSGGMAEVGITNAVSELLQKGKVEQAERLLKKHDIDYSITKDTAGGESGSEDGVTTQGDDYDKSDATGYCTIAHDYDNRYLVSGIAAFDNSMGDWGVWGRIDWCPDALAITYNDSHWASGEPTQQNVFLGGDEFDMQYKKYNANVGLAVEATPESSDAPSGGAQAQTYLYWTGDNPDIGPKFTYHHTSAMSPSGTITSISLSAGSFGISLNTESSHVWNSPLEAAGDVPV